MTTVDTIKEHIQIVEGAYGPTPVIAGHRIRVADIVHYHEELGWPAHRIAEELPTISIADVYAAMAYYWDNQTDVDAWIAEDARIMEELRRANGMGPVAEKRQRLRHEAMETRDRT